VIPDTPPESGRQFLMVGVGRVIQKVAANGVPVGVAEQTPSLPFEQFKRQLIELVPFHPVLDGILFI
jgi:hypothetical protein